jgi:hypothetical protein
MAPRSTGRPLTGDLPASLYLAVRDALVSAVRSGRLPAPGVDEADVYAFLDRHEQD